MAEGGLQIPPVTLFDIEAGTQKMNLGPNWDQWLCRFENFLTALDIEGEETDGRKISLLLHFLTIPDNGTTYQHAKTKLNAHFQPQVNDEYEKASFRQLKQKSLNP